MSQHHGLTRYETVCQPLVGLVGVGLNIPPVILGIIAAVNWCPYYGQFLVPNAVLCLLNLGAIGYSVYKLRKKVEFDGLRYQHNNTDSTEEEPEDNGPRRSERVQANSGRVSSNGADAAATSSWATNPADENKTKESKSEANGDVEQGNGKPEEGPATAEKLGTATAASSSQSQPAQSSSADDPKDIDSNEGKPPHS
ncbi:MAG: hypothetical protein SGARI_007749, partial [Bacillariaceae sp.]